MALPFKSYGELNYGQWRVYKFSKNVGVTSELSAPEVWHGASSKSEDPRILHATIWIFGGHCDLAAGICGLVCVCVCVCVCVWNISSCLAVLVCCKDRLINLLSLRLTLCINSFNIQKFCVLPTMHLCVLRGSQNKQRLFLYTASTYRFLKPKQRVFTARYEMGL